MDYWIWQFVLVPRPRRRARFRAISEDEKQHGRNPLFGSGTNRMTERRSNGLGHETSDWHYPYTGSGRPAIGGLTAPRFGGFTESRLGDSRAARASARPE